MQPQLIRIRKVLADISMNYINKDDVGDFYRKNKIILSTGSCKSMNDLRDEISVVQHMSAACRAAWSHELKNLPSAWLLRQVKVDWSRSQIFFEMNSIISYYYCSLHDKPVLSMLLYYAYCILRFCIFDPSIYILFQCVRAMSCDSIIANIPIHNCLPSFCFRSDQWPWCLSMSWGSTWLPRIGFIYPHSGTDVLLDG